MKPYARHLFRLQFAWEMCISENMRQIQFYSPSLFSLRRTHEIHLRFEHTNWTLCNYWLFNWWIDDDTEHSKRDRSNMLNDADDLESTRNETRETETVEDNAKAKIDFLNRIDFAAVPNISWMWKMICRSGRARIAFVKNRISSCGEFRMAAG